jgi:peptidoglycan-associated lipoprotein
MQVNDTPRRQVVKTKNLIIFLCLIVFVLAYAGCAEKHLTKNDGTASAQNESAIKQTVQPVTAGKSAEQNTKQVNSKEQTMGAQAAEQIAVDLTDIHFDFDRYSISPEDRQILSSHAGYLLKNKNVKIVIEGNCDERGTTEYNLALGDKRAREAKKFLVNSGVDQKKIKTISYGKERPLDPDHNEEAWAKNRRDHFVVSK